MTKLTNISRFQKSIHPREIEGQEVIQSEVVQKIEGHNTINSIEKIDTPEFKGIYLVTTVAWGGDDVSETFHAFENLTDAKACYDYYNRPISEIANELTPPPVHIKSPNGDRHLNLEEYQGFVVQSLYGGELLRPFLAKTIIEANGWKDIVNSETDVRELIGTKYEVALLRYDREVGGVTVTKETIVRFITHTCWETGLQFLELAYKYPKEVFDVMKPSLQYHSEEIEEEGDWKGWYVIKNSKEYNTLKNSLETIGWKISNDNSTSDDD